MVQLIVHVFAVYMINELYFNSTMVQLIGTQPRKSWRRWSVFQFYYGSINSPGDLLTHELETNFNSTMVQLIAIRYLSTLTG